jgi:Na+-driven multidrug efflux pump
MTDPTNAASPPAPAPPALRTLLRRILALAAPTSLVAVLQSAATLIETWLAARQGTAALAGWAVVLPFALVLQQMSAGAMGGGVVSAIARALGAGRGEEASALVLHALLIGTAAGAIFVILLAGFPSEILGWVGGREAAQAAASYSAWLFGLGAVPAWLTNTLASVLRGGGRHGLAARVMVAAWIVYPLLAWLLMEPAGMGLAGAGAAFGLTMIASALAMGVIVWRGGAGFAPTFRVRPSGVLFKRILSVGLVASSLAILSNLSTILVTAQMAAYGTVAVAAYGVSARLEFLIIPLAFGVGSALTALVGRAVGAGDWLTARRTAWAGALLALGVAGTVGVTVLIAPHAIASALSSDPAVATIAARAFIFIGPALAAFGAGMALYFASIGASRMRGPVVAGLARVALAAGGGWLLAHPIGMGLDGQFLGVALGLCAYGAITALSVRPGVWPGPRG